jgi:hypothetical protein
MNLLTMLFSKCLGVCVGRILVLITITNWSFGLKSVFSQVYSLHKGYKCLHVPSNRVFISRDVIFYENVFSFSALPTPSMSRT